MEVESNELAEEWFLSAGEVNAEGEISLSLLTSKIIDVATAHANALGVGNPAMEHLGRGWVLTRMAIEMERYPKVNERYGLVTWVEDWNKHFSIRNFMVTDDRGEPCGYATSVWMVLDTHTRENAGLSHLSPPEGMISSRKCPIKRPGKHLVILPLDCDREPIRGEIKATADARDYRFGYSDLDFYRHVNTVRYVSMLLNQFSLEQMDRMKVHRLEMAFMREGRYSEPVKLLRSDRDEGQTMFSLADADDGTPLLFASVSLLGRNFS